jgi:hypothetical protein
MLAFLPCAYLLELHLLDRSGNIPLQFLNVPANKICCCWNKCCHETQTDKQTKLSNDFQILLDNFINLINSQNKYNAKSAQISAIPIIVYHKINYKPPSPDLSDAEMRYLHDNGFKVLTMSNLKYNQNTNSLYSGDVPGITAEAPAS